MDVKSVNHHLSVGKVDAPGVLPRLQELEQRPYVFSFDFGLDKLPEEPGFLAVRGARQYGKSTWLEQQIRKTVESFGPATAYYLNGDELASWEELLTAARRLLPAFRAEARVRRLFIDEITAVKGWERAIKRLADAGELQGVLVVTTGSKATDLRRGVERLPGRKGRLARTSYHFLPISFAEFQRVCGPSLQKAILPAYLLSGGSPIACAELADHGRLPEYVVEMVKDWIYGECAAVGRDRGSLLAVLEATHRYGGTPVGQAKMAREAGLANNTVAAGYLEMLSDLMCLAPAFAWDADRQTAIRRRPAKFHFVNLLAAVAWSPQRVRSIAEFEALPGPVQGKWWEWAVAQELWRRSARAGAEVPEQQHYWQTKAHELDFVVSHNRFLEVKRGTVAPVEFAWFAQQFPGAQLTVVGASGFATDTVSVQPLDEWLAGAFAG